jgi:hypothetical protein
VHLEKSISLVADWLECDFPDLGSAIEEFEVTLHFFHDGPAKKSLGKMQEEFHKSLKFLPKTKYFQQKQRFTLDVEGKFTTGYEIERQRKPPIQINLEWVKSTLETIIDALPIIKQKIGNRNDFDFDGFKIILYSKLDEIPYTVKDLESIQELVVAKRETALKKLDEWEKLGIDWEEYHPNARKIVPILFSMECIHMVLGIVQLKLSQRRQIKSMQQLFSPL